MTYRNDSASEAVASEAVTAFLAWASSRYTKRSTRKLVLDVQTMVRFGGMPPEAQKVRARLRDYRWAWDVWHDAAGEIGLPPLPIPRPELPERERGGRRVREPKRLLEAKAFGSEDFAKLREALILDNRPAAMVLLVMAMTGLRIGDVLRIKAADLRAALAGDQRLVVMVKGEKPVQVVLVPAFEAWQRLASKCFHAPQTTVADAVVGTLGCDPEAGGAAYERCRRAIKRHGLKLELDGRVHLHRLRRTVAVELLRAGESLETVQQVLIHENLRTTESSYADEARSEQAAAAMSRLNQGRR